MRASQVQEDVAMEVILLQKAPIQRCLVDVLIDVRPMYDLVQVMHRSDPPGSRDKKARDGVNVAIAIGCVRLGSA